MGPIAESLWRRFYCELEDHEHFKMKSTTHKFRVTRIFSADGIRHERVARLLDKMQFSSAFLLMGIIGNFYYWTFFCYKTYFYQLIVFLYLKGDFYCFAPVVPKDMGIGGDIETFQYNGIIPLDAGIIMSYDAASGKSFGHYLILLVWSNILFYFICLYCLLDNVRKTARIDAHPQGIV